MGSTVPVLFPLCSKRPPFWRPYTACSDGGACCCSFCLIPTPHTLPCVQWIADPPVSPTSTSRRAPSQLQVGPASPSAWRAPRAPPRPSARAMAVGRTTGPAQVCHPLSPGPVSWHYALRGGGGGGACAAPAAGPRDNGLGSAQTGAPPTGQGAGGALCCPRLTAMRRSGPARSSSRAGRDSLVHKQRVLQPVSRVQVSGPKPRLPVPMV